MAVMVVSVALTAFIGLLAYSSVSENDIHRAPDTAFTEHLSITDGTIDDTYSEELVSQMERNSLNGIRFKVSAACSDIQADMLVGEPLGLNADIISGTVSIPSDDGRVYAASFEVIYWWD